MGLDKFRLIELTTNSGKNKYKPQVFLLNNKITTGMWWWKKIKTVEDWRGFFVEPDNTYMYSYEQSYRDLYLYKNRKLELIFDTKEEAKEAIEKFKIDMKERMEKNNDATFMNKSKIIDIE